jgi:beta-phosphoglucomutase
MNFPVTKAVLFDFNGVIVDDFEIQKEAWNEIFVSLGKPPISIEKIRSIRGIPTKNVIKQIINPDLSDEEVDYYAKKKEEISTRLANTSPLFKLNVGLENFLNELQKSNLKLNIATSKTRDVFEYSFNRLELSRWFDFSKVLCKDGTHEGKPAPDPFIISAKNIDVLTSECIVFEDAISGIKSAYSAGVKGIVVVNVPEFLKELIKYPGVIKGIVNFSEIEIKDIV